MLCAAAETLREELRYDSERARHALQITISVLLVVLVMLAAQMPFVGIAPYLVFLLSQDDTISTRAAAILGSLVTLSTCLLIVLITLIAFDAPWLRVPLFALLFYGGFYLMRTFSQPKAVLGALVILGLVLVAFQVNLILSGNLAFLNWVTLVPVLACFDDRFWRKILPARWSRAALRAREEAKPGRVHAAFAWGFAVVVAVLSIQPVSNLFSERQIMNTSFDPFKLVNTYGAFGSVGRVRNEIVLEGTSDSGVGPDTVWREYEWKCKPGDPEKRPCWITPYHMRLDWLIWFAAMSDVNRYPWIVLLMEKLMQGDAGALSLLEGNPFPDRPPKRMRAQLFRYAFTEPGDPGTAWWKRERLGGYVDVISLDDPRVDAFLQQHGLRAPP